LNNNNNNNTSNNNLIYKAPHGRNFRGAEAWHMADRFSFM